MTLFNKPAEQLLEELGSNAATGLTASQVEELQRKLGENKLREKSCRLPSHNQHR